MISNFRYKAYLKSTGDDPSKTRSFQFALWIWDKWGEFMKEKGIKTTFNLDAKYGKQFDAWLERRL